jgi:hypothetical protein
MTGQSYSRLSDRVDKTDGCKSDEHRVGLFRRFAAAFFRRAVALGAERNLCFGVERAIPVDVGSRWGMGTSGAMTTLALDAEFHPLQVRSAWAGPDAARVAVETSGDPIRFRSAAEGRRRTRRASGRMGSASCPGAGSPHPRRSCARSSRRHRDLWA